MQNGFFFTGGEKVLMKKNLSLCKDKESKSYGLN